MSTSVPVLISIAKDWEKKNPGHSILLAIVKSKDEAISADIYDSTDDAEYVFAMGSMEDVRARLYSICLTDVDETKEDIQDDE